MRDSREVYVRIIAVGFALGGILNLALFLRLQPLVKLAALVYRSLNVWLFSILVLGLLGLAAGIAIWLFRGWGRILGIVLSGVGILGALGLCIAILSTPTWIELLRNPTRMVELLLVALAMTAAGFLGGALVIDYGQITPFLLLILNAAVFWALLMPAIASLFGGPEFEHVPETTPIQPSPWPAPAPPQPRPTKPVEQPFTPVAWLVVRKGGREGQFRLSGGTNVLGRDASKCDIVIDDDAISREHAKIRFEGGRFWIYDLASRNGTFVNNRKVQRQMLMDGDQVQIGDTVLVFKETR